MSTAGGIGGGGGNRSLAAFGKQFTFADAQAAQQITQAVLVAYPKLRSGNFAAELVSAAPFLGTQLGTRFGSRELGVQRAMLEQVLENILNARDNLGDIGQSDSLKIQQVMERYTTFSVNLSEMMKKLSDTSKAIVANMK